MIKQLNCSYETLSRWIRDAQLPIEQLSGSLEPFSIDDVWIIRYAWAAIRLYKFTTRSYFQNVVAKGKAKSFEVVFEKRYGGGDLALSLEKMFEEVETNSEREVISELISYIKEKENADSTTSYHPRTTC